MKTARGLRALACAAAVMLTAVASATPAQAQTAADVAAARDLFREGSQLAKDGSWAQARDRFERSLKLKRAAITLYSLGVAQQKTNQHVEALESFRAFLAEPVTPGTEQYVAPTRDAVTELEKRVARVSIRVSPPDAPSLVVAVDGHAVPEAIRDRPRLVNAGTHEVTARATGFAPASETVSVSEGGSAEVTLSLVPAPQQPPPLAPPLAPRPTFVAPPPPAEGASRVAPVALMGGGGALFAGGLVVGVIGWSQANDAATRDGADADSARTKGVVADVMMGVGLAAVGAGVIVWLVQGPARSASATAGPPASHAQARATSTAVARP
jgi:hypothetical protein